MRSLILALLAFAAVSASAEERYRVKDSGSFASTGRHVEFADRFGWESYEAQFDFSFEEDTRQMSPDSVLSLTIRKRDGGAWSYRCKARDRREMWANVNRLYGKGVLVLAECRVRPGRFAKAVGLDEDVVGEPTLVFSAKVDGGKASVGLQKGFYFLSGGQIEASVMNQYATQNDDPSDLAVLFASAEPDLGDGSKPYPARRAYYQPAPRFVP